MQIVLKKKNNYIVYQHTMNYMFILVCFLHQRFQLCVFNNTSVVQHKEHTICILKHVAILNTKHPIPCANIGIHLYTLIKPATAFV